MLNYLAQLLAPQSSAGLPQSAPQSVFQGMPQAGSKAHLDLVQAMTQSGMQSAMQTGSPIAALLAPALGNLVQSRAQSSFDEAQTARNQTAQDTLLAAMNGNADRGELLGTMLNDSVDPAIQKLAGSMLNRTMTPPKPKSRAMKKDQNGRLRYLDSGQPVFPDVEARANPKTASLKNSASKIINDAIIQRTEDGFSREEAYAQVIDDPVFAHQVEILGLNTPKAKSTTPPPVPDGYDEVF